VQLALDLGCGAGRYTLDLASRLGTGRVMGFDLWREGVEELRQQATARGLDRCAGEVGDISSLPAIADGTADLALLGTVLHDLVPRGGADVALAEAARVLRPDGWLAVVEFHPRDTRPGPPRAVRLAPKQVDDLVVPHGFAPAGVTDLGQSCYLALYHRT
jgi:ubiquinone/menaquinone biosynthesis C-methylase UbiE